MPRAEDATAPASPSRAAGAGEVAAAFLLLGLSSFGGPIAHLGYFRREFVARRRWLDESEFGELLALTQSLPGPASSQLGFAIGLLRAGWRGGVAAFAGFTLPSALVLFVFARYADQLRGPWGLAMVHGLKLVAVTVVAQALLGMARHLTPDVRRAGLAATAAILVTLSSTVWIQLVVIAGGGALGPWLCKGTPARTAVHLRLRYGARTGWALLAVFTALLLMATLTADSHLPLARAVAAFYRTGAMVFGGGHVVLPLLKQALVDTGLLDNDAFLAGYGAAQAVPGPLFSVAAFLGDRLREGGGAPAAVASLIAIFAPGLLLVAGVLPFWTKLSASDGATRILAGVNAAVVGLLAAALYDPLWVSAVQDAGDRLTVGVGFVLLAWGKWPAWSVVLGCVLAALLRTAA